EHRIVSPDNLEKIDMAFFHINSLISILLFTGVLLEAVIHWQGQ
ncbi:MAG: 4-hydroxybenzoate octaprenyltransferase, partial [Desulfamplus sp.]|nr:4-hydroxybenzoate octaprenyltransferase [Desulfamplus sp.]